MSNRERFLVGELFSIGRDLQQFQYSGSPASKTGVIRINRSAISRQMEYYCNFINASDEGFEFFFIVFGKHIVHDTIPFDELIFVKGGADK